MIDQEIILQTLRKGAKAWNIWRKKVANEPWQLDNIELIGLNLDGIDLSKLSVKNCVIKKCSFRNADLISTNFSGSQLLENDFSKAKMIATNLDDVDLSRSNIYGANMLMASTKRTRFDYIDFLGHDLTGFFLKNTSLINCALQGQDLTRLDLSHANLTGANLEGAILTGTIFNGATLTDANINKSKISETSFKDADLIGLNLSQRDLEGCDFRGANLTDCDLRQANLKGVDLSGADVTGAKLARIERQQWVIPSIQCSYAYWDDQAIVKTKYSPHEFERIYADAISLTLHYPYRLTTNELSTLSIMIEHLQAVHWGTILRLRKISDVSGGAELELVVEETGSFAPAALKESLQQEAERVQLAQLALRSDSKLQMDLKERLGQVKEEFWPRLLELAADHEHSQVRNLTVVLMDLKGFSTWGKDELSDKLALFRGLLKPVLNRWDANYPNMEGDSLRITFTNATMGVSCSCMIRDVLTAAGFEIRIGIELGEVAVIHNEVTDIADLEGVAVNMAARMEAIAEPGEVLVSQKVRHYTEHRGLFEFEAKRVYLSKNIGKLKKGDGIDCFTVTSKLALQDIK